MLYKEISIDPEVMSGTPVFAGTRVPIKNLFDYIEEGESINAFLDDFPSIKKEQVGLVLKISFKQNPLQWKLLNWKQKLTRMGT